MKMKTFDFNTQDINTSKILTSREHYQRKLDPKRVDRIVKNFDERIANEPKVSFRDGNYYVFDGQHTIAARKRMNGDKDLDVRCKVYHGMTAEDEALLFAQQTGESSGLSSGSKIRARIYGKDPEAVAFKAANEEVGISLDFDEDPGGYRIGCISTAFKAYRRLGPEGYMNVIKIMTDAWKGLPESFRAANITAVSYFTDLYRGEYDRDRLVRVLAAADPLTISRKGKDTLAYSGYKKYLYQLYMLYTGTGRKYRLPIKF